MSTMPSPPTLSGGQKISAEELRQLRQEMLGSFEEFENSFRRNYPITWWGTLVGPFLVTFLLVGYFYFEFGGAFVAKLISTTLAAFFFFGRFIILGGEDPGSEEIRTFLTSGQLFALMSYLDLFVAVILSFHIGFLFKVPVIGPKVAELVADGRVILVTQPWMRRMTFIGLVAFVVFPLAATGSVGGSIFGRLLGMSRWATLSGIGLGTIIGNGIMYVFSDVINYYLDKDDPLLFWGGMAVIVALIIWLERRYRKMKKELLE